MPSLLINTLLAGFLFWLMTVAASL